MRHAHYLPTTLALLLATAAVAQEDAGTRWPVQGVTPPGTELALELYVTITPAVAVGASDHGTRRFIPITGGHFIGNAIKGEVMSDGAVIVVDNRGIIAPGNGGIGYARTNPQFHAPQGKYEWLNKTLFVGTITPSTKGGAVIIRVFKVL
jgi:hypothetical protein